MQVLIISVVMKACYSVKQLIFISDFEKCQASHFSSAIGSGCLRSCRGILEIKHIFTIQVQKNNTIITATPTLLNVLL